MAYGTGLSATGLVLAWVVSGGDYQQVSSALLNFLASNCIICVRDRYEKNKVMAFDIVRTLNFVGF